MGLVYLMAISPRIKQHGSHSLTLAHDRTPFILPVTSTCKKDDSQLQVHSTLPCTAISILWSCILYVTAFPSVVWLACHQVYQRDCSHSVFMWWYHHTQGCLLYISPAHLKSIPQPGTLKKLSNEARECAPVSNRYGAHTKSGAQAISFITGK